MSEVKILAYLCGGLFTILIPIVTFIFNGLFSRMKSAETKIIEIDKEVGVFKADQNNSNKRFDELNVSFKAFSDKIDDKIDMILTKLNTSR